MFSVAYNISRILFSYTKLWHINCRQIRQIVIQANVRLGNLLIHVVFYYDVISKFINCELKKKYNFLTLTADSKKCYWYKINSITFIHFPAPLHSVINKIQYFCWNYFMPRFVSWIIFVLLCGNYEKRKSSIWEF